MLESRRHDPLTNPDGLRYPRIIEDYLLVELAGWDEATIRRQRRQWKQDLLTAGPIINRVRHEIAEREHKKSPAGGGGSTFERVFADEMDGEESVDDAGMSLDDWLDIATITDE